VKDQEGIPVRHNGVVIGYADIVDGVIHATLDTALMDEETYNLVAMDSLKSLSISPNTVPKNNPFKKTGRSW
jgi:hypothetical protein